MRAIAAIALLLPACVSNGSGRYLMVSDTYHGPITWHRFPTPEACEQARRGSDVTFELRCTTARDERIRRWEQRRAAR